MTQSEANTQLTSNLKALLKKQNHIDSGKLYQSIKVTLKQKAAGYTISVNAMEYLKYLDDGDFITNFIKSDSTKKIISKLISDNLKNIVTKT